MVKKILTFRTIHLLSALMILGVFIVSAIAYIQNDAAFLNIFGLHEIGRCYYRENFGLMCPSCGLTRSFISIENLNFADAIKYNRIGVFIYILFVLTFIFNILGFLKHKKTLIFGKVVAYYGFFACVGLILSWVLKTFLGL